MDSEAAKLQDLHKMPVSESVSPEEGLLIMMSKLIEMSKILSRAVVNAESEQIAACEALAQDVHKQEEMVTKDLVASSASIGHNLFRIIVRFPGRLERIGDMFQSILTCCRIKQRDGIPFSDKVYGDLAQIFTLLVEILTNVRDSLIVRNKALLDLIVAHRKQLAQLLLDARFAHWDRLEAGFCAPSASSIYLDILDSLTAANEYVAKMCDSLIAIDDAVGE